MTQRDNGMISDEEYRELLELQNEIRDRVQQWDTAVQERKRRVYRWLTVFVLVFIGIFIATIFSGCSVTVDSQPSPSQTPTATASSSPTATAEDPTQAFLDAVKAAGIGNVDTRVDEALAAADEACTLREQGGDVNAFQSELSSSGVSADDAAVYWTAALLTFCPQE